MIPISTAIALVEQYLEAEENERLPELLGLFDESVIVHNAANPVDAEPGAVERFARSFWDRTEDRSFVLDDVGISEDNVFALVEATLRFRKGSTFGAIIAAEAFTITLPVAIRFRVNTNNKVTELDIFHETTSAARLAAGAAA